MTDPDELGRTLLALATVLDRLLVTWAIGGSLASAAHGEPYVNPIEFELRSRTAKAAA